MGCVYVVTLMFTDNHNVLSKAPVPLLTLHLACPILSSVSKLLS
jgi:hypothetical protein